MGDVHADVNVDVSVVNVSRCARGYLCWYMGAASRSRRSRLSRTVKGNRSMISVVRPLVAGRFWRQIMSLEY